MRRDISRSIALQGCAPMDPACAGISTAGLATMNRALVDWEKRRGIERPKYGRSAFSAKCPERKPEPKPAPKPKPKTERKPRKIWRKYDPAIPRHKRPNWIAYRKKYVAEHPLTDEQRRVRAERCKAYRAKYSPEQKAAELARVRAWKAARKQK